MKKTLLSLTMLVLGSSAFAGPLEDKVNAYNNMRANRPNTPVMNMNALLRNEVGTVSSSTDAAGRSCAICGLGTTQVERPGAGSALPAYDPLKAYPTPAAPVLDSIPPGLGVPPAAIVRTYTGTGASWQSPNNGESETDMWAGYEMTYWQQNRYYQTSVNNIINSYMDPVNGKLAQAKAQVLDLVAKDMATWLNQHSRATMQERIDYEASRVEAYSDIITSLTAKYKVELDQARKQFDAAMTAMYEQLYIPPGRGDSP